MDVFEITRALWRKKWIILVALIVTAVVSLVLLKYRDEKYKSTAQIATGYTTKNTANLTENELNQNQTNTKFSNLMALMNSPVSFNLLSYRLLLHDLDSVENRFRLRTEQTGANPVEEVSHALKKAEENVLDFFDPAEEEIRIYSPENIKKVKRVLREKLENMTPLHADDPDFELIRQFYQEFGYGFSEVRESTVVYRLGNTDYVQVEFVSENRDLSAYAANAFCQEFIRYYNSLISENTGESVQFLREKIKEKREELDEKVATLEQFKEENNLNDMEAEGGTRVNQLIGLETQKDEIESRIQELELTMARLRDDLASYSTTSSASSNLRIVNLQNQINSLNSKYISSGSRNQEIADSLNMLRSELSSLIGNLNSNTAGPAVSRADLQAQLKDAEIAYKVETSRLKGVNEKIRDLRYNYKGYSSNESKLQTLQKEVDLTTDEHLELVNRYNLAKNNLAARSIRQTRVATPSLSPVSMKKIYILAMACAASFALAVFVIALMEVANFSIKTPSKFKRIVGLPLIGNLNKVNTNSFNIQKQFASNGSTSRGEINKSLLRQIRFEVESLESKVLLFTSLKAQEGKTFTMYCVAYILSLLEKRVLIIDTNFKNNSLTQLYGKDLKDIKVIQKMVPSKLLSERIESDDQETQGSQYSRPIYKLVNPTKYKNVFFIGNIGIANSSPSEILSSKDFHSFIDIMKERYDYVLMEGAALNEHSDTKELVDYAEKVIAVVSADSVIEPIDQESIRYLKTLNGKFGGTILNKVYHKDLKL